MNEHMFAVPGTNFKYCIEFLERHPGRHVYKVDKVSGDWLKDQELINLADSGDPNVCYNFGGAVEIKGDIARVDVYVD